MAIDAIARNKAEALIREQLVNTIQQDVPKSSTVMQLGTRLANMTSNQTKIPVLSMLPLAYWVNGDTGMKKTSKQEWDNVYMTAAELAVIVPVPEAVLADSSFDIMGEVQPRVREAMGAKIDNAILFGGERPTEWTTDVLTLAAKNKVTGPIDYAKLLGKDGLFSKVEAGGFGVDAVVGDLTAHFGVEGGLVQNNDALFAAGNGAGDLVAHAHRQNLGVAVILGVADKGGGGVVQPQVDACPGQIAQRLPGFPGANLLLLHQLANPLCQRIHVKGLHHVIACT